MTMQLFVNNLTNVDFSYLDAHRGLVGETWLVNIILDGSLDEAGMVCDFGIVKKKLRTWLDREIDHRLLVPSKSTQLSLSHPNENSFTIDWKYCDESILSCTSPAQAITLIDTDTISEASVAAWCISRLASEFPTSVDDIRLEFIPESISTPYYHYSHGLKKHDGNCQRIAHGHRSKIEIWRNGKICESSMQAWAKRWQDIYIGTVSDINSEYQSNTHSLRFDYHAAQGQFSLTIPKKNCYLIESDTTVEFIAQHIANTLKKSSPKDSFVVKAYEGLGKGAIASS